MRIVLVSCQSRGGIAAQKGIVEPISRSLGAVEQERRLRRSCESAIQIKRVGLLFLERENQRLWSPMKE